MALFLPRSPLRIRGCKTPILVTPSGSETCVKIPAKVLMKLNITISIE